jgi:AAA15 family ATPase/GTPase
MILQSHLHNENSVFTYKPFKFAGYGNKPSVFSIKFVYNDVEYDYSFSLTQNKILAESLYYYPNDRKAKVFTRNENIKGLKKDKYSFGTAIKRPMDVAENTSEKTLYLSRASQMDRDLAKELFVFFNNTFILGFLNLPNQVLEASFKENKNLVLKALQIADSDIVDLKIRHTEVMVKNLNVSFPEAKATVSDGKQTAIQISSFHKLSPDISFDFFTEESNGTRNLFEIILTILDVIKNNKMLIIDEIESSLHTSIVEFLLKLFYASDSAQLIFSTHNTNLLNLDKIRKDQVYFVNKKEDASTDLYSLFDYKDFRDTMDVEKAYLQGRFDAVPFIDDSITNLKSLING